MRNSVRLLLILLLLFSFLPREALCQDGSDSRKLKQINLEIKQFEEQQKYGIRKIGAGLGLSVLGYIFFLPTTEFEDGVFVNKGSPELYAMNSLGALILIGWGGYEWWDASQQLAHLRSKRYDFSFAPTIIIPNSKSAIAYGAKVSIEF